MILMTSVWVLVLTVPLVAEDEASSRDRRLQDADAFLQRMVAARADRLGTHHPTTLEGLEQLRRVQAERGEWKACAATARRLLEAREKIDGPDHDRTLSAMEALAEALVHVGSGSGEGASRIETATIENGPIDHVSEQSDSIWAYLSGRYDQDRDGAISRKEYLRSSSSFQRLDVDADGSLTAKDFEMDPAALKSDYGQMSQMLGSVLFGHHFQVDEDRDHLTFDEVEDAFAGFDVDEDGQITSEEFRDEAEALEIELPALFATMIGKDRFSYLLEVADFSRDSSLTLEELDQYFMSLSLDEDEKWKLPNVMGEGQRNPLLDSSPSAVGKVAPDFELTPLHGGDAVRLSSFKDQRPVALIFGSYT